MDTAMLGSGDWIYRLVDDWVSLPPDVPMPGDVAGVAVDDEDNVYAFARGSDHAVLVFDREGQFLRSWGDGGLFVRPHAVDFGADGYLYFTDDGLHCVRKFDRFGKMLMEIGIPGKPAPRFSGQPFHRCTHTALSPEGDIFVSDGYGNARIHKFSPDGKLIMSWGDYGTGKGEFNLPHNITSDADGWLYVADRENHRVQVFDQNGRYETQWNELHRPCGLCTQKTREPLSFIAEAGTSLAVNADYPNIGPRVSIVDHRGELVARLTDNGAGFARNQLFAPHGIAVDSRHTIYVAELNFSLWQAMYPDKSEPGFPFLRKFVRVGA